MPRLSDKLDDIEEVREKLEKQDAAVEKVIKKAAKKN